MHNVDTFTGPSFSLKNRIARFIWQLISFVFFRLSPRPFHQWRAFLLTCFGAKVGRGVHVYPSVKIWAPWNLVLHDECGIGDEAILYSQDKITIGYRAVVSQRSHLCTGSHDYTKPGFPLITSPIYVGHHAWIATEVFVHPGIRIGDGCVVGARAVVTYDMPEWFVCAGHPSKPIKVRIGSELINQLAH